MDHHPTPDEKLEHQKAAVIRFLYWFIIIAGGFLAAKYLLPVFMPFVIAYLIAWALNRPISWLSKKTHLPRGLAAVLLILLFATGASGLLTLLGAALVSGIRSSVGLLPSLFTEGVLPALEYFFNSLEQLAASIDPVAGYTLSSSMDSVLALLSDGVVQLCGSILGGLGSALTHVPSGLMKTLISLIASVFIAMDFDSIRGFLVRMVPVSARHILHLSGQFFGRTLPKCLGSYLVIFLVTFCELTVGLWLLRVSSAPVVALVIALLDILPVLGTGTVLIPWAVFCLFTGKIGNGIGLLVLYLVITLIRNTLEPRLVGRQIQLHPVITFMGMLAGLRFFGFFGMLGLPMLLAFLRFLHEQGVLHIPALDDVPEQPEGPPETDS